MLKLLLHFAFIGIFFLNLDIRDACAQVQEDAIPTIRFEVPLDANAAFDHGLSDLVRQFNSQEKRFQVTLHFNGTTFQNLRGLIASHFAGDLPEIAILNAYDVDRVRALGLVLPVPKEIEQGGKFSSNFVTTTRCDGRWCGIPFQRRANLWFYNRELLFKFDQKDSALPGTWKEILRTASKANRKNEICGLVIAATSDQKLSRWWSLGFGVGNDPIESSIDWLKKNASEDITALAECLDYELSYEEAVKKFLDSKTTVLLGGIEQLHFFKSGTSFRMGTALTDGDTSWYGTDIVLLSSAKSKLPFVEAFLRYIYSAASVLELQKISYSLPLGAFYANQPGWSALIKKEPILGVLQKRKLSPQNLYKLPPQSREEWGKANWKVFLNASKTKMDAEEIARLRAALQILLSTNKR